MGYVCCCVINETNLLHLFRQSWPMKSLILSITVYEWSSLTGYTQELIFTCEYTQSFMFSTATVMAIQHDSNPYIIQVYAEFKLATWLRLDKFTELNISEFCFWISIHLSYHWSVLKNWWLMELKFSKNTVCKLAKIKFKWAFSPVG